MVAATLHSKQRRRCEGDGASGTEKKEAALHFIKTREPIYYGTKYCRVKYIRYNFVYYITLFSFSRALAGAAMCFHNLHDAGERGPDACEALNNRMEI